MNTKQLKARVDRLTQKELRDCVEAMCLYLYGKSDDDGVTFYYDGSPADTGEELEMCQDHYQIQYLVTP